MSGVVITDLVNTRSINGVPSGNPTNGAWIFFDVVDRQLKAKFYDGSIVMLGSFRSNTITAGTGISVTPNSNGTVTIGNTAQNDNLGNHTATQDLNLATFNLTGTDSIKLKDLSTATSPSVYHLFGKHFSTTSTSYPASLRLYADDGDIVAGRGKYIGVRSGAVANSYDIILPATAPAQNQVLQATSVSSGSLATLSWSTLSTSGSASAGNQYDIQISDGSSGFDAAPWQINTDGHLLPAAADASDGFGSATNPVAYAWLGKDGVYFHKDNSTPATGEYAQIMTDGTYGDLIFKAISHNNNTNYEFKAIDNSPAKLIIESGTTNRNFSLYAHPSPSGNQVFKLPPAIGRKHTSLLTIASDNTANGELDWKCVTNTFGATYGYATYPTVANSLSGTGGQAQVHVTAGGSSYAVTPAYIYQVVDETDPNDHCKVTINFDFKFRAFDGDFVIPSGTAYSDYAITVHFVGASDNANIETLGLNATGLPTGATSIASFTFVPTANEHRIFGQASFAAQNSTMSFLSSDVRHGSGTVVLPAAGSPLTISVPSGSANADKFRDIAVVWQVACTAATPALTAFVTGSDFILVERSGGFS